MSYPLSLHALSLSNIAMSPHPCLVPQAQFVRVVAKLRVTLQLREDTVMQMFLAADKNGDGEIEWHEFVSVALILTTLANPSVLSSTV